MNCKLIQIGAERLEFTRNRELRFWRAVNKKGAVPAEPSLGCCWEWTNTRNAKGYGHVWINYRLYFAHRISYALQHSVLLSDVCVLHKCDNPSCVNPQHLFVGSRGDNMKDCLAKKRYPTGVKHHNHLRPERLPRGEAVKCSKLSEADVIEMRSLHARDGNSITALSAHFKVAYQTAWDVISNRTWRHVKH